MTGSKTDMDKNHYKVGFRKRLFALVIDFIIMNFFDYLINLLLSVTLFRKYYINHASAEPGSTI